MKKIPAMYDDFTNTLSELDSWLGGCIMVFGNSVSVFEGGDSAIAHIMICEKG